MQINLNSAKGLKYISALQEDRFFNILSEGLVLFI